MTVKDFVLEHGGTRHICMENIYKVPYETLVELVKLKCKEQREICAEKATTFSDVGGTFVDTDSILNAPEPEL